MATWMWSEAFQPPVSPPCAFEVLATISMENMKWLRVRINKGASVHQSDFSINQSWVWFCSGLEGEDAQGFPWLFPRLNLHWLSWRTFFIGELKVVRPDWIWSKRDDVWSVMSKDVHILWSVIHGQVITRGIGRWYTDGTFCGKSGRFFIVAGIPEIPLFMIKPRNRSIRPPYFCDACLYKNKSSWRKLYDGKTKLNTDTSI